MEAVRKTNGTIVGFKLLLEHYEEHNLEIKTNKFALLNSDELNIVGEKFMAVDEFSSQTKTVARSPPIETYFDYDPYSQEYYEDDYYFGQVEFDNTP